jgi:hypothetical protein
MPFIAVAFGLGAIWIAIRRYRRPAGGPEIDAAVLARYHDQIEKEVDKLD